MPKRHSVSSRGSKRLFRKTAAKTHKANVPKRLPMRGGIRM